MRLGRLLYSEHLEAQRRSVHLRYSFKSCTHVWFYGCREAVGSSARILRFHVHMYEVTNKATELNGVPPPTVFDCIHLPTGHVTVLDVCTQNSNV